MEIHYPKKFWILGNYSGSKSEYSVQVDKEQNTQTPQDEVVEVFTPEVLDQYVADSKGPLSGIWSRKLRVKITGRDGSEKLDIRIPVSHCGTYFFVCHMFISAILSRNAWCRLNKERGKLNTFCTFWSLKMYAIPCW